MENNFGEFRFAYFTDKYEQTTQFYLNDLEWSLLFSWERNSNDKGAVFVAGEGKIEILHLPNNSEELSNAGLDYRKAQGAFVVIQAKGIDALYEKYDQKGIPFKQRITNQSWGHRSFSILDPNGIVLFFYENLEA
jgi:catechol 2,3-dioxygenase-like lactoylglutathione lyase family enzyme